MVRRGGSSEAGGVKEGYMEAYQGRPGGWGGALMLYVKAYHQIRKERAARGHGTKAMSDNYTHV